MRIHSLAAISLMGALAFAPAQSSAQVSVSLHLGTPVVVHDYAPTVYGDWHTAYRTWTPVTRYYYDGRWYAHSVHGARAVVVYRSKAGQYFLPPRDAAWKDKRYNLKRRPIDEDYNHVVRP